MWVKNIRKDASKAYTAIEIIGITYVDRKLFVLQNSEKSFPFAYPLIGIPNQQEPVERIQIFFENREAENLIKALPLGAYHKTLDERSVLINRYLCLFRTELRPQTRGAQASAMYRQVKQADSPLLGEILTRLRHELFTHPILFYLLPEEFTLYDCQLLVEMLLNRQFDRPNFRRRLINGGFLRETEKHEDSVSHRPAQLFQFDFGLYEKMLADSNPPERLF